MAVIFPGGNLSTEDQAAQKWCPFVRTASYIIGGDSAVSANRDTDFENHEFAGCIGSKCMAWRWVGQFLVNDGTNDEAHGYCGLVCKPTDGPA